MSTADAPGPPGLTSSEPIRWPARRNADHRQLCLCPTGFGVVDRNGHGGALRGGDVTGVIDELDCSCPSSAGAPRRRAAALGSDRHRVPVCAGSRQCHRGCPATSSPNESSAELNGLRRDMAAIVAPRIRAGARKGHALISYQWPGCQHFAPLGGVVPPIR